MVDLAGSKRLGCRTSGRHRGPRAATRSSRGDERCGIALHAQELGVKLDTEVFDSPERWCKYALDALRTGQRLAGESAVEGRLHLLAGGRASQSVCPVIRFDRDHRLVETCPSG